MSTVFAVRGDSLDARYSSVGKEGHTLNPANPAVVDGTEAGINGSTSINMDAGAATLRAISYVGGRNGPSTMARSYLVRAKFPVAPAGIPLFSHFGYIGQNLEGNGIYGLVTVGGEVSVQVFSGTGGVSTYTSSGASYGSTSFHDFVFTWTGDTTTNGLEAWLDGTRVIQDTSARELDTMSVAVQNSISTLLLGSGLANGVRMYVDEFVIWDEIIDPTSVTLTSGSGSLNGASRTAYVDVDAYDGISLIGAGQKRDSGFGTFG